MKEALLIGFHAIACAQFAFAVYYDFRFTVVPRDVLKIPGAYGGKFKFLTFWNAIIQTVFFFICLLNDFYGTNKVAPKQTPILRRIKDYFHATYSFPLAMFVGITFWCLMFIDRELVLPKALDPYFPNWLNHLMHTMIMVTAIIETIAAPRQYPTRIAALTGLYALMLVYLIWIHVIYHMSGVWTYPVMEVLSLPLRLAFFLVLLVLIGLIYYAGEVTDRLIWGNKQTKLEKTVKTK